MGLMNDFEFEIRSLVSPRVLLYFFHEEIQSTTICMGNNVVFKYLGLVCVLGGTLVAPPVVNNS